MSSPSRARVLRGSSFDLVSGPGQRSLPMLPATIPIDMGILAAVDQIFVAAAPGAFTFVVEWIAKTLHTNRLPL